MNDRLNMTKHLVVLVLSIAVTITAILSPCMSFASANKVYGKAELESVINGIINWKKLDNGSTIDGPLINNAYLEMAGTTPGDWYQIGMSRFNYKDEYDSYMAVITDEVEKRYKQSGKLHAAKATEWHRIGLAILAAGGDPTSVGKDQNGNPINLIADGSYNRGKVTSLGRQGINGWIWGLILLDSKRYEVPEDAYYTRGDIIVQILSKQLEDGGFSLSGKSSDPDISAMAIQALAPYYNSSHAYTYTQAVTGQKVSKTVRQVVDETLSWLSSAQLPTGDFKSWGTQNVESTDQVVVALCCLGINPQTDERFIKNGVTLLDGIMSYRMPDGGFIHSRTYDSDNPTSLPDKSNTMAGEQTLYTLVAVWRQMNGMSTLYDFRDGKGGTTPSVATKNDKNKSDKGKNTDSDEKADDAEEVTAGAKDDTTVVLKFTKKDLEKYNALPQELDELTTEHYVDVITLLAAIEETPKLKNREKYIEKLERDKEQILSIQAEIDSINADVKEMLYPFDKISVLDYGTVHSIVSRYENLSDYDKQKILRWEDVVKTKTQVDNLLRAIVITVLLGMASIIAAVFIIKHIKKRKNKKVNDMAELAKQYEEEQ
ncbi:MAG: prenyltransferase/squalene oxidase repeat-containing protein [Aminipila sp.]